MLFAMPSAKRPSHIFLFMGRNLATQQPPQMPRPLQNEGLPALGELPITQFLKNLAFHTQKYRKKCDLGGVWIIGLKAHHKGLTP
jgi:hypothetical protein